MSTRETSRRNVGVSAALVAGGAGVVTGNPSVFLVSVLGLVYAAYQAAIGDPEPTLTVERAVETTDPLPGTELDVTVTLRNDGDATLPDVRVRDGVPERLDVVAGSPRFGTHLEPGESDSFTYTLRARRGEHAFAETTVVCRNLTGTVEFAERVGIETAVECSAPVDSFELSAQTLAQTGRVPTDAGGDGVSFYAIREHQSADPMSRVDWNRLAKTNELATVEFRESRAASVVVLVDSRHRVASEAGTPTALQYCAYAAEEIATALLDEDNRVGAAVYDDCASLRPSASREQARRLRSFLADVGGGSPSTDRRGSGAFGDASRPSFFQSVDEVERRYGLADGGDPVATLHRTIPGEAQVVFCTPLLDDRAVDAAKRLSAYGHGVTVVSPDMTSTETPGATLEHVERDERVGDLRGTVRVVDWPRTEPLAKALVRSTERWSR